MNNANQCKNSEALFDECLELLKSKGIAYSGEADAHANFKRMAEKLGTSKYQILAVYMSKHVDCVFNAIAASGKDIPVDGTEGLHSRIVDAVNYLAILDAMLFDEMQRNEQ